ncbi:MAG: alpha/beta hydrolase [Ruthenibacterium sp.]
MSRIIWVIIGLLLVLAAALFFCTLGLFRFAAVRHAPRHWEAGTIPDGILRRWAEAINAGRAYLKSRPDKEDWFCQSGDGLRLHAAYYPAPQPSDQTVVAVHGFRADGATGFAMMVKFYHGAGCNVLLVDDRAHGESEGKYIGFGWLDKDDVLLWLAEVQAHTPGVRILLHGISMGAATVLMTAGNDALPRCVKGAVSDCAYTSAWEEFTYQLRSMLHLPVFPLLQCVRLLNRWLAKYDFRCADTVACAAHIKIPVLLIHGEKDKYVPTQMVQTLYKACTAEKTLLLVPDAGHAQSYAADSAAYEKAVHVFLQHTLCDD